MYYTCIYVYIIVYICNTYVHAHMFTSYLYIRLTHTGIAVVLRWGVTVHPTNTVYTYILHVYIRIYYRIYLY